MDFILYRHWTLEKEVVEFNTIEELLDFIDNNFKRWVIINIQHKAEQHVLYAWTPYDRWTMQEYTGVWLWWTE